MGIVHAIDPVFPYADLPELGLAPSPELIAQHNAAQVAFRSCNYGLGLAIIGACLGLTYGGIVSPARRLLQGVLGAIGGTVGGAVSGYFLGILVAKLIIASENESLLQSTGLHFATWAIIATIIVALVALVHRRVGGLISALTAGIATGMMAAMCYVVASSFLFADANLVKLIPEALYGRIVWVVICAGSFGIAARSVQQGKLKLTN